MARTRDGVASLGIFLAGVISVMVKQPSARVWVENREYVPRRKGALRILEAISHLEYPVGKRNEDDAVLWRERVYTVRGARATLLLHAAKKQK